MTVALLTHEADRPMDMTAGAPQVRRWLHVISHTDPRYGGLSSAVPALAASLQQQYADIAVSMAAFCHAGETVRPVALAQEDISFWPTSRVAWIKDRELGRNFQNLMLEADAVHIHGLWEQSTAVACRLARKLGKPYVLSAHGMLEPWALNAKRLKKQVYAALLERANVAGAACLHALTSAEAEQYRRFGAGAPIATVPNAVDPPQQSGPQLFLEAHPHLEGKRLVLFLSRLHPKKGLDLLMEAWPQVVEPHAAAHLVLAGPDPEGMQAELLQRLPNDQVRATVTFTGMLNGAMKWSALRAAEIFVLPSYSEGLSMALLEAMGAGLPVIATYACNMPEITAVRAGLEIEATAVDLAAALRKLLSQPSSQNHVLGANGARLIASRYSMAEVTRQMAEVYRFVLEGQRPEGVPLLEARP